MDATRRWKDRMPESRAPDGLETLTGMNAWRATHSIATLAGTGLALDECLMALRRRMLHRGDCRCVIYCALQQAARGKISQPALQYLTPSV